MLTGRGKSLAVRETVPVTGRSLQPLRVLLKIWMNGPGGLVTLASRDEIFAGVAAMAVEAYGYSERDAQGLILDFTSWMITSVARELTEREVVRTITTPITKTNSDLPNPSASFDLPAVDKRRRVKTKVIYNSASCRRVRSSRSTEDCHRQAQVESRPACSPRARPRTQEPQGGP
jgi:hypothetical protein